MDSRAFLQQQFAFTHQQVHYCVGDVTDEEARRMPNATLSPIIWQVGHLAWIDTRIVGRIDAAPKIVLPEDYATLFGLGTGGPAAYPPFDAVLRTFDAAHEGMVRVLAEADLDAMAPAPPIPGMWSCVGEMLGAANGNRWYHIGKVNTLRALLGKPRLFG